jgi:RHS repeat-associated protein
LQSTYYYGQGVDEPIAMDKGNNRYYFHQNAQSSVIALTDSVGQIVERYAYDGLGNVAILDASYVSRASSAVGNAILFTGQYYDEETNLYFFKARHYHPALGRFMQRDPLAFNDGANLYHGYFLPSDTDPVGMSKRKIDIELFGFAAYEGLGGGASVTESIEEEDCCKGKELIPYGKRKVTYAITAQAGIGVGGKAKIAGIGIDLSITGPQIFESLSLIIENKTCDGPYNKASLCKESGVDFGISGAAGAGIGGSATLSTKGSMKFCSEAWAWGGKMEVSFCGEISIKIEVSIQIGATFKHTLFEVPGLPSGCQPAFTHNW